jgi:sortase A
MRRAEQTRVPSESTRLIRAFLRFSHWILFVAGLALLIRSGYVVIDSLIYQSLAKREFIRAVAAHRARSLHSESPSPLASGDARPVRAAWMEQTPGPIARLEIPRLNVSAMVLQGASDTALSRGPGHIENTAYPGEHGNVGIAGHRNTIFRPLERIQPGDEIVITTVDNTYRYRVSFTKIVLGTAGSVLDPALGDVLTLVTCFPFDYIGSAPNRFIVRALPEAAGKQLPTD